MQQASIHQRGESCDMRSSSLKVTYCEGPIVPFEQFYSLIHSLSDSWGARRQHALRGRCVDAEFG